MIKWILSAETLRLARVFGLGSKEWNAGTAGTHGAAAPHKTALQRYKATLSMYDKPGVCYGRSSGGVTNIETALRNSCATTIVYYEGHL
jgi:hypothetical protein